MSRLCTCHTPLCYYRIYKLWYSWGNSSKLQMDKILLKKRAIRNITPLYHTNLFFERRILKVQDVFSLHLGTFMFQLNNKITPGILFSLEEKITNCTIYYSTRQAFEYNLPQIRTRYAYDTIVYSSSDWIVKRINLKKKMKRWEESAMVRNL